MACVNWDPKAYTKYFYKLFKGSMKGTVAKKYRKYFKMQYFYYTKQKWYDLKKKHTIFDDGTYRIKNPIIRFFIHDKI